MEFLKERVYTALNADELKIGSKVIVSDNLNDLRHYVECEDEDISFLTRIEPDSQVSRFYDGTSHWILCYLVSEPEEKKLKWTDLKVGDVIRSKALPFIEHLITGIDKGAGQVFFCNSWAKADELDDWEKVEE